MNQFFQLDADDATVRAALAEANPPALLAALVHLTGDTSILRAELRPDPLRLRELQAGFNADQLAELQSTAFDVLTSYRSGRELPPIPDDETMARIMNFCAGTDLPPEYVPMMIGEMAFAGRDEYSVQWHRQPDPEALARFPVLVIGAGMSGLCAAIRLQEAGIPYVVVDKNQAVGGTWHENTYPGCRVDVQNHFYSYSFEPNHQWPEYYSRAADLQRYFESCTDKYGVRPHVRFGTEVVSAQWDSARSMWRVELSCGESIEHHEYRAIISGVGQLNRPKPPAVTGLDRFAGPAFHSARWRHEHDLTAKRVAVIGAGASAMQFAPEIAPDVDQLTIFQRSPNWANFSAEYHLSVSDDKKWLLENVPFYDKWYRFLLFWRTSDGAYPALQLDPDWPHPERSLNAINDFMREMISDYIRSELSDRPDLVEKAIPSYPPFGKRILIDNGWFKMLKRDNVELVTDVIREVTPKGVLTEAGRLYEADVLIFGTGFESHKFLWPMRIVGRSGRVLNEVWADDPRAYLGITVPDFPNLFCLYGPNTNLGHGGSIIFHTECQVRYVVRALREMIERDLGSIECRAEVHDRYNALVDEQHAKMVWAHPGMTSWYKNANGRVTTNSPWRLVDYWKMTREPDLADYVVA